MQTLCLASLWCRAWFERALSGHAVGGHAVSGNGVSGNAGELCRHSAIAGSFVGTAPPPLPNRAIASAIASPQVAWPWPGQQAFSSNFMRLPLNSLVRAPRGHHHVTVLLFEPWGASATADPQVGWPWPRPEATSLLWEGARASSLPALIRHGHIALAQAAARPLGDRLAWWHVLWAARFRHLGSRA
jgi:hypothetical protein